MEPNHMFFQLKHLVDRWYRDSSGYDLSSSGDISLGSTLSRMIWQAGASILRYSYDLVTSDAKNTAPNPLRHMTPLQSLVARHFDKSRFGSEEIYIYPYLDEQFLKAQDILIPKSASVVRGLQPIIGPRIRRRNLWITDWTTYYSSREQSNSLVLYHRLPSRSAIPRANAAAIKQAEELFPRSIDHLFNQQILFSFLDRNRYIWPEQSISAISEYVQTKYLEIRPTLVMATAQIDDMLDFYQPESVNLPGDAFELWNLWYQRCYSRDIESFMYMDGYQIVPLYPMIRTRDNQDWLVHKIAAFGSAQTEMYTNKGFPASRVETVECPFLLWKAKPQLLRQDFDAIVLTWIPNPVNPLSDTQSPATTLRSVLTVLFEAGFSRVAIKIKHEAERTYVLRVISEFENQIVILTGYFHHHISRAPLFIGGISTALAEAVGRGLIYIVFEPLENGYPDELLTHSTMISVNSIARDSRQLAELLHSKKTSWVGNPKQNLLQETRQTL